MKVTHHLVKVLLIKISWMLHSSDFSSVKVVYCQRSIKHYWLSFHLLFVKLQSFPLTFPIYHINCMLSLLQMMEVLRDDNELVFLYQLVKGHSNNSLACHITSIAALPQQLIERGNEVSLYQRCNEGGSLFAWVKWIWHMHTYIWGIMCF